MSATLQGADLSSLPGTNGGGGLGVEKPKFLMNKLLL